MDGFGSPQPLDETSLTAGWESGYKLFYFKNSGILFENDAVQIGVKSSYKDNAGQ